MADEGREVKERMVEVNSHWTKDVTEATLKDVYKMWAKDYDHDVGYLNRDNHHLTGRILSDILGDNKEARILDVAAGTGLSGQAIAAAGFSNIDALDASADMLEKAKEKGIYGNHIEAFLTAEPLDIPPDTYDAITCVGANYMGHITESCFPEMIRIVKPGGPIILLMSNAEDKMESMEGAMQQLQHQGAWQWRKQYMDNYHGKDGAVAYIMIVK